MRYGARGLNRVAWWPRLREGEFIPIPDQPNTTRRGPERATAPCRRLRDAPGRATVPSSILGALPADCPASAHRIASGPCPAIGEDLMDKLRVAVTCARHGRSFPSGAAVTHPGPARARPRADGERGQGLAEYALILAGIAIVAIVSLVFLGGEIDRVARLDPVVAARSRNVARRALRSLPLACIGALIQLARRRRARAAACADSSPLRQSLFVAAAVC